jgi:hypothetical protein
MPLLGGQVAVQGEQMGESTRQHPVPTQTEGQIYPAEGRGVGTESSQRKAEGGHPSDRHTKKPVHRESSPDEPASQSSNRHLAIDNQSISMGS